jgi:hypothetical protein
MNDRATLRFDSPLGPSGSFKWLYHVAPIVQVRQDGQSFKLVMDPGVTKLRPLQVSEWLGFQNDNSSTHRFTAAGIYGLDIKTNQVVSDFGFTRTPAELNKHFDKLEYIEVVNAQLLKSPILNSIEPPIISTEENRKNERT